MSDRLAALEKLFADRLSVECEQECTPHAHVLEYGVVEVQVDMLVDQARLVANVELVTVAFLESQG